MSVSFDPPPIPLARDGAMIRVIRYDPNRGANGYIPLPNIVAVQLQIHDGDSLPVARFRYRFLDGDDPRYPSRVSDVLGLDKSGPYIIKQDDRLCIMKDNATGNSTILFDGYAQIPQGDLSPTTESATFEAIGVAVRELPGVPARVKLLTTRSHSFGEFPTYRVRNACRCTSLVNEGKASIDAQNPRPGVVGRVTFSAALLTDRRNPAFQHGVTEGTEKSRSRKVRHRLTLRAAKKNDQAALGC